MINIILFRSHNPYYCCVILFCVLSIFLLTFFFLCCNFSLLTDINFVVVVLLCLYAIFKRVWVARIFLYTFDKIGVRSF